MSASKTSRDVLALIACTGSSLGVPMPAVGQPWTDPVPLNNNAATDSGSDYYPQVTTDGAGNWVAVWESSDDLGGTIGIDWDILVARISSKQQTKHGWFSMQLKPLNLGVPGCEGRRVKPRG